MINSFLAPNNVDKIHDIKLNLTGIPSILNHKENIMNKIACTLEL